MLRTDEQELVAQTVAQAKQMPTDRLVKTLASMRRNLGSEMICIKPGVYTTPECKAAVFVAVEAEIAKR